jgi:ABC-2 type transport system ATP-binding protein
MHAIVAEGLTKTYGSQRAIDTLSFSVEAGEAVALIGANGSGKTTLIHTLLGLCEPDPPPHGGERLLLGRNSRGLPLSVKQETGLISDDSTPMPWARLADIQRLFAALYANWDEGLFERHIHESYLDIEKRLCDMSKGERRLAEIFLVTSYRPAVLFLDEPFNGLDPLNRRQIAQFLRAERSAAGTTIFYSTHVLPEIADMAERVVILRKGRIEADAVLSELGRTVESLFFEINGVSRSDGR